MPSFIVSFVNPVYHPPSVCWPTKLFMKNSLFIFTSCLPITPIPFTDIKQRNRCWSLGSRNMQAQKHFTLVPLSLEQPPAGCPFSHFSCNLHEVSQDPSLWRGLSPVDTSCFIDFAVEHQFGCHATEPGYTGDIGGIEIWLIDWLILAIINQSKFYSANIPGKARLSGATAKSVLNSKIEETDSLMCS